MTTLEKVYGFEKITDARPESGAMLKAYGDRCTDRTICDDMLEDILGKNLCWLDFPSWLDIEALPNC